MKSLSEIETTTKRASRAIGFSWGISEEIGKCIRLLEMFGLPGIKNLNQYYKDKLNKKFENIKLISEKNHSISFREAYETTASIVNFSEKKKKKLNELSIDELKKIEPRLTTEVLKVFNLKNSINSKKSYGGTSFDNIKKMIIKYRKNL